MAILGHEIQRRALAKLLKDKKLPSTLMLAGTEGIGKKMVGTTLAKSILCEDHTWIDPDSADPEENSKAKMFNSGNNPDFYQVECLDKATWDIEAFRELLYSLNLTAFSGASRVVLFNDAEHLSIQAANALLKSLEEPRPGTYFILVCSNPSKLPPTLRSRCQLWFFDNLTSEQIKEILSNEKLSELGSSIPESERGLLADGSLKNLTEVEKHYEFWPELTEALSAINEGDAVAAYTLSEKLGKDRKTLRERLHLMRIYTRKRMLEADSLDSQNRWALMLHNLLSSDYYVFERNLSAGYLLNVLFSDLIEDPKLNPTPRMMNANLTIEDSLT